MCCLKGREFILIELAKHATAAVDSNLDKDEMKRTKLFDKFVESVHTTRISARIYI